MALFYYWCLWCCVLIVMNDHSCKHCLCFLKWDYDLFWSLNCWTVGLIKLGCSMWVSVQVYTWGILDDILILLHKMINYISHIKLSSSIRKTIFMLTHSVTFSPLWLTALSLSADLTCRAIVAVILSAVLLSAAVSCHFSGNRCDPPPPPVVITSSTWASFS